MDYPNSIWKYSLRSCSVRFCLIQKHIQTDPWVIICIQNGTICTTPSLSGITLKINIPVHVFFFSSTDPVPQPS